MGRDEGRDRGIRKGRREGSAAQNGQHKGAVAELPAVELRRDESNDAEVLLGVAVGHRRSPIGIDNAASLASRTAASVAAVLTTEQQLLY